MGLRKMLLDFVVKMRRAHDGVTGVCLEPRQSRLHEMLTERGRGRIVEFEE